MITTFVAIIVVYVVSIFVFAVNDVRIHGIVCIVDTDIPGTHTMFGLLVEVDAEIQTMAGGKAVIVTPGDVTGFLNRAIGPDVYKRQVLDSPFAWFDRAEYETSAGGVRKVRVERP